MEKSIALFKSVEAHNWDDGHEFLKKILTSLDCDKGTVLLIYWLARPQYYAKYRAPEEVPMSEWTDYQFVLEVARVLVEKDLPEVIAFNPVGFVGEQRKNVRNPDFVLNQFYRPTGGHIDGNALIAK